MSGEKKLQASKQNIREFFEKIARKRIINIQIEAPWERELVAILGITVAKEVTLLPREVVLAALLKFIWKQIEQQHHYEHIYHPPNFQHPYPTKAKALQVLKRDFATGNKALKDWSALYYKFNYLMALGGEAAAQAVQLSSRQWRRHSARGLEALVAELYLHLQSTPEQTPAAPQIKNLPLSTQRLIGRKPELTTLASWLVNERWITITGEPGVGKTVLALHLAQHMQSWFKDGVIWIGLENLAPQATIANEMLLVLGLQEGTRYTLGKSLPPLTAIQNFSQDKKILYIFDNCEHVHESVAILINNLWHTCPEAHFICTNLKEFTHPVAKHWTLAPLACATQPLLNWSELKKYPALELFLECCRAADPEFSLNAENSALIHQLCAETDGLPLAIEIMAANLSRLHSPVQNSLELQAASPNTPRHQSLATALDWSYQLLTPSEQILFRRLGIFNASCTFAALTAICAEPEFTNPTLQQNLAHLIAKSLCRQINNEGQPPRYYLLEPIKKYARQKLEVAGESAQLSQGHYAYCVNLITEALQHIQGEQPTLGLEHIDRERHEWVFALRQCAETRDYKNLFHLANKLTPYWELKGLYHEGFQWFNTLPLVPTLEQYRLAEPEELAECLLTLRNAGALAFDLSDFETARLYFTEGLNLSTTSHRPLDRAWALYDLVGLEIVLHANNFEMLEKQLTEAQNLFRQAEEKLGLADVLSRLGFLNIQLKQDPLAAKRFYQESKKLYEELHYKVKELGIANRLGLLNIATGEEPLAFPVFEYLRQEYLRLGDQLSYGFALLNLGRIALRQGKFDLAETNLREAQLTFKKIGHLGGLTQALLFLGELLSLHRRQYAEAKAYYLQSLALCETHPLKFIEAWTLSNLGDLAYLTRDLSAAQDYQQRSLLLRYTIHDYANLHHSLEGLALIYAAQKNYLTAVQIWGALQITADTSPQREEYHLRSYEVRAIQQTSQALGADEYQKYWEQSRSLEAEGISKILTGMKEKVV